MTFDGDDPRSRGDQVDSQGAIPGTYVNDQIARLDASRLDDADRPVVTQPMPTPPRLLWSCCWLLTRRPPGAIGHDAP